MKCISYIVLITYFDFIDCSHQKPRVIRIKKKKVEKFKLPRIELRNANERVMPPSPPRPENELQKALREMENIRQNLRRVGALVSENEVIVID